MFLSPAPRAHGVPHPLGGASQGKAITEDLLREEPRSGQERLQVSAIVPALVIHHLVPATEPGRMSGNAEDHDAVVGQPPKPASQGPNIVMEMLEHLKGRDYVEFTLDLHLGRQGLVSYPGVGRVNQTLSGDRRRDGVRLETQV
jgi:hypothetical protein